MLRWILKQLVLHACCCVDDNRLETAADFHFISIWKNTETINAVKWHPPPKSTLVPTAAFSAGGYKLWNHFSHFHQLIPLSASSSCVVTFPPPSLFLFLFSTLFDLLLHLHYAPLDNCVLVSMRLCFVFFPCMLCCTWKSPSLSLSLSLSVFLSADHSITLETCRQAARELHTSLRKTVMLYTTVSKRQ